MSNLNGGLSGSGTLRGTLGGGGVPAQDVYWDDILNKPNFATVATSGSYNDLVNKPNLANVATSGSYNDLTDKPTIPAAQVNADWNATSGVAEILNKPTIPAAQVNADWDATSGVAEILNKPTFATVATSGSYNDLTDTPTIPPAQVNADWNAASGVAEILNKPTIPTTASQIDYDNTTSGLQADDVQDAITELKSNLTQLITHTTIEQNFTGNTSNCIKIGDLKIQFGIKQCYVNTHVTITFKEAFSSTGYVCFASYTSESNIALNQPGATVTGQTTTSAKLYTTGGTYAWVAIGY